jgi:hypothetical protein
MSVHPATVKPPESLAEALRPIATLSESEFTKLALALSGPRSFSLSKEQLEALQKDAPGVAAVLPYTLGTLAFLYSQIEDVPEGEQTEAPIIAQLVDDLDPKDEWASIKSLMKVRLTDLLGRKKNHERFKKVQRLQNGFIPNATGFSTFLDLRPDFNEGKPEKIQGVLPVIQLRISTDADNPTMRRLVVQLDEDGLAELKKAIDRLTQKIEILKTDTHLASHLIKS